MVIDFITLNWKFILEIIILWYFYYLLLIFIQGTRAVQVLKGMVILLIIFFVSEVLKLKIIHWILTKLFTLSVIGFLIIFQPELRRGLAKIGQFGIFYKEKEMLDELAKAAIALSKKKVGALIALEREVGLKAYIESGVQIDSHVSGEIINTIFTPNTPLHDGGIIVQGSRIVAAGCLFPLTQNPHIPKTFGTRHRAAIGLCEETDAIVLVVSEETGGMSIATGGKITRHIDEQDLPKVLSGIYRPRKKRKSLFAFLEKAALRVGQGGA